MSYEACMQLAGAIIHAEESFGDYHGRSWALVTYEGKTGWVEWWWGSCTGCDSFEGEFGHEGHVHQDGNYVDCYNNKAELLENGKTCDKCKTLLDKMIVFGKGYLNDILTQEEALKEAGQYSDWDEEGLKTIAFIAAHDYTKLN